MEKQTAPLEHELPFIKRALPFLKSDEDEKLEMQQKKQEFFAYYHDIKRDARFIRDEYGVQVKMNRLNKNDGYSVAGGNKLNISEGLATIRALREEISKYPTEIIDESEVRQIRILNNLKMFSGTDRRVSVSGLADYTDNFIYLSLDYDLDYFRETIHHELFHLLDFAKQDPADNEIWNKLNPNGKAAYIGEDPDFESPSPHRILKGFAEYFAPINEDEDQASIATFLMSNIDTVLSLSKTDAVLGAKFTRMINIYNERSKGTMNLKYFEDLAAGIVDENYWAQNRQKRKVII